MSAKVELLSPRNLILAATAVLVLSVLGMVVSMLRPHDSKGLGRDSFGTRRNGHRALFELLAELGVSTSRDLAPPRADVPNDRTLLMIAPNPWLLAAGPKYAQSLLSWVEQGGRLVVAPASGHDRLQTAFRRPDEEVSARDVLRVFRLHDRLSIEEVADDYTEEDFSESGSASLSPDADRDDAGLIRRSILGAARPPRKPPQYLRVECRGSLAPLSPSMEEVAVPAERFAALKVSESAEIDGSIAAHDPSGAEQVLVAVVRRGAGEFVVVAEPAMLSNALIAEGDNSVLAAHLIAPSGEAVVFDEFYHGLAVRGNPLYLLTRPGFAVVTAGLLLSIGVWTWRSAVFLGPPLADREPPRRDIREYVEAMARLFCIGRDRQQFLLREFRDGVLRQLCQEARLPQETTDAEPVVEALARRDAGRAGRLAQALSEVDAALAAQRDCAKSDFVSLTQRLANCL